jgi:SAM-dependent methyltransferase
MENLSAQRLADAAPLKLDLGCGPNKRDGFHGVDVRQFDGKVDTVLDLARPLTYKSDGLPTGWHGSPIAYEPWPWADDSVDEAHSSHFVEHLTGAERVHFFNELYRVLRKGAKVTIIVPAWNSERAYGDPTHQWPPFCGFAFFYLDKGWREANAPHVGYTCDFEFVGGNSISPQWAVRNQEVQAFAQTHYVNVAQDIHVTLTKR